MSRARTRRKAARRANEWRDAKPCKRCGLPGRHYLVASMGEPGFWLCEARP